MQPPDGTTKVQYVRRHMQDDLSLKSHGHIARFVVGGSMLVLGLGVVAVKYIVAIVRELGPTKWESNELILVLCLIGGALAILFTHTFLSVMHVIWPFGKGK